MSNWWITALGALDVFLWGINLGLWIGFNPSRADAIATCVVSAFRSIR